MTDESKRQKQALAQVDEKPIDTGRE